MKLPPDVIAAGKAALQALWEDRAIVKREQKQGNVMQDIVVYDGILCHLSQSSQPTLEQSATVATTQSEFTLFVDTKVKLREGDTLEISHKGQIFVGVAGQPFSRNFSNAVKVEVNKIA